MICHLFIKYDGVYWHSNGELCRNSNVLNTELPCNIDRVTNMTFCKSKNDSQEHVKYPISVNIMEMRLNQT